MATLEALRDRVNPFTVADTLDRRLRAIHALSNPRHNPRARAMEAPPL